MIYMNFVLLVLYGLFFLCVGLGIGFVLGRQS